MPSTSTYVDRKFKCKYFEFIFGMSVFSSNGDAFAVLMVDDDEELLQTTVVVLLVNPKSSVRVLLLRVAPSIG